MSRKVAATLVRLVRMGCLKPKHADTAEPASADDATDVKPPLDEVVDTVRRLPIMWRRFFYPSATLYCFAVTDSSNETKGMTALGMCHANSSNIA